MKELILPVRYYRLYTDPDVACVEENFHHVELTWPLPAAQTALVMVDVWDLHYIQSHEERSGRITRERLAPVVAACRETGMTIIHAPAPQTAHKYPQWTRYAGDGEFDTSKSEPPSDWPPEAFRKRTGEYENFTKPWHEPVMDEWKKVEHKRRIVAAVAPHPDDFVIATGDQLHRLLRHRQILHLLYAGFAANICVLYRDYGTRAMGAGARGYNIILIRDCTTAIEAHDTFASELLTKAAVLEIEMQVGYSTTSTAVIEACRGVGKPNERTADDA